MMERKLRDEIIKKTMSYIGDYIGGVMRPSISAVNLRINELHYTSIIIIIILT